jgi:membrane-associated phospholipid phosphatase
LQEFSGLVSCMQLMTGLWLPAPPRTGFALAKQAYLYSLNRHLTMFKRLLSRGIKKFWAAAALLSVEMIIVLTLFVGALALFVYVIRRVFVLNSTDLDQEVFRYLQQHVNHRNNEVMLFFTFLGRHEFLIPANLCLIAYYLFIKKSKWYSIKVPAMALSSLGLMFALKGVFNRPRPLDPLLEQAKGLSFPSGHALMSVTFYGLLIYIVFKSVERKDLKWTLIAGLVLLILIIGFSRIYLRVHYTSDVVAGYCIGFLWLVFALWVLNKLEEFSERKLAPVVGQPKVPADR